jgi:hypothetical protein
VSLGFALIGLDLDAIQPGAIAPSAGTSAPMTAQPAAQSRWRRRTQSPTPKSGPMAQRHKHQPALTTITDKANMGPVFITE